MKTHFPTQAPGCDDRLQGGGTVPCPGLDVARPRGQRRTGSRGRVEDEAQSGEKGVTKRKTKGQLPSQQPGVSSH